MGSGKRASERKERPIGTDARLCARLCVRGAREVKSGAGAWRWGPYAAAGAGRVLPRRERF